MSGRSSAYGDTAVEGHPAGPGSVSSSTGAISTTTAQQEGEGSEGEGETEGDIHTSNRSETAAREVKNKGSSILTVQNSTLNLLTNLVVEVNIH